MWEVLGEFLENGRPTGKAVSGPEVRVLGSRKLFEHVI